jgi:hypothetical protein
LKDRERHIERGEDPDDMKSVFEDMRRSFEETKMLLKKHAEKEGIDISNIKETDERDPPEPDEFPLYQEVAGWQASATELFRRAHESGELWLATEAAADLNWYKDMLTSKTYRQLVNQWEIAHGDDLGEVDYKYTGYVLSECTEILKSSLRELSLLASPQRAEFIIALVKLQALERKILAV